MKAGDVEIRFRREIDDVTPSKVDSATALQWLQDAIEWLSDKKPMDGSSTFNTSQDVVDYSADAGVRVVFSLWDETDSSVDPVPMNFLQFMDGSTVKIRLTDYTPGVTARTMRYYYTADYTSPTAGGGADEGTVLDVEDGDAGILVRMMCMFYAERGMKRSGGRSFKIGQRSESGKDGADWIKSERDAINKMLAETATTGAVPATPIRPNLAGASANQGAFGWNGLVDRQRRRPY